MDDPTAGPNSEIKSRRTPHSSRRASHRRKSSCSSSSKSSRRSSDHQKAVSLSGTVSYLDAATPATVQVSAALTPQPEKVASTDTVPLADVKARRESTFQRFRDMGRVVRTSFTSSLLDTPVVFGSSIVRRLSTHSSMHDRVKALNAASTAKAEMKKGKEPFRKMVFSLLLRAAITVFALGFVIAVVLSLTPHPRQPDLCRSHSCLEYADRLLQSMNASADPCDSMTRYVCSGWTAQNALSVRLSVLDAALSRLSRFARSASSTLSHPQTAEEIGATFFRSCDAVIRGERNELISVRRALAEAGVAWPGHAIGEPDALRTLLFAAIRLGWTPILDVDILPDSSGEPSHRCRSSKRPTTTVVLTPSREFGMLARKRASQQARPSARALYVQLLSDHLGSGSVDASARRAFEVADRVDSEFLDPLASVLGDSSPARTTTLENSTVFKGRRAMATRWRDALSGYGVASGHDVLLRIENGDFVRTFIDIWETKGETETHMFVSWCIVQVAALFASQRLIASFYESEQHSRVLHSLFCLAHTYLLSGFELFTGYITQVFYANARDDADALVRAVRDEYSRLLARWPNHDKNVTVVADWNSTAVAFNAVDRTIRESGDGVAWPDAGSHEPLVTGDSLVKAWRLVAAAVRASSRYPRMVAVAESMQALSFYANVGKEFILMPYVFAFPLYDEDAAKVLNYAGLGSQVAQALGELFLAAYRTSSPPAREPVLEYTQCVLPDAKNARQDESQVMQVLSFNVLFDAYRASAQAGDKRLPGLEALTLPQLLFVAACYADCPGGGLPSPASFIAGVPDPWPGGEPRCDAMLRRTSHFARTFGCAPGKRMNTGAYACSLFP
ncbi:endothelin-converting enzyme 1 [Rhipicephalus sanguineus]|uniref:endothelin-converting enzyme 1 n=1 Tax=Rhipicephalus sanguineus TaxID=34632 RepID=UPI0018954C7F|nr:endothelin-converting enzyme 1 [Rhipicephalus sanguineus]